MHELSTREYENFKTIVKMTQPQLHKTLVTILQQTYGKKNVIASSNGIIAKGTTPIMLVAHLDTVFHSPPQNIYYDKENNVIWSPEGLGADDRAGVFAILHILSCTNYRPHIAFTTDEEIGCVGATNLSLSYTPAKNSIRYIIELDRRGKNDCVFYECGNQDFIDFIESFGFVTELGSFSDIVELCPQWNVCGVNLSIGYVNEHSYIELLHVDHMFRTIKRVIRMLNPENIPQHSFKWIRMCKFDAKCASCGKILHAYEQIPISDGKKQFMYCGNCIGKIPVEWCDECYEGYLPGILDKGVCPNCKKGKKIKYFNGAK